MDDGNLASLISMGFDPKVSRDALVKSKGDIDRAIESLLHCGRVSSSSPKEGKNIEGSRSGSSAVNSSKKKQSPASITSFFSPKPK